MWLVNGAVLHRDSLGSEQVIRPGQLNVMTAVHGISHSEETPGDFHGDLHGVQLWVALPESRSHAAPAFEQAQLRLTVVVGEACGERSPATSYTPQVAMEIIVAGAGTHRLTLDPAFEYGVIVLEGVMHTDRGEIAPGTLYYMSVGHDCVEFETAQEARLFLVGGEVFEEEILMFWNFVGRTRDEIIEAATQWNAGDERFGEVTGYSRGRMSAPEVGRIKA